MPRNFTKFTGKHLPESLFWINLQPLGLLIVLLNSFGCRRTLTAQNRGANIRLQHWENLMTAVFFIHHLFIDFCHPTNRNQVFSILENVFEQLLKVINRNFAFGKCKHSPWGDSSKRVLSNINFLRKIPVPKPLSEWSYMLQA